MDGYVNARRGYTRRGGVPCINEGQHEGCLIFGKTERVETRKFKLCFKKFARVKGEHIEKKIPPKTPACWALGLPPASLPESLQQGCAMQLICQLWPTVRLSFEIDVPVTSQ